MRNYEVTLGPLLSFYFLVDTPAVCGQIHTCSQASRFQHPKLTPVEHPFVPWCASPWREAIPREHTGNLDDHLPTPSTLSSRHLHLCIFPVVPPVARCGPLNYSSRISTRRSTRNQGGRRWSWVKWCEHDLARGTQPAAYKTRFMIIVFLYFGPSFVGNLHVLRMPPWARMIRFRS